MDKKRLDVYGVGIIFLILAILFSILTIDQINNIGWNISSWVLVSLDGFCGVFGIGSLLKPDTFGAVVLRLVENYQKSQAQRSDSSTKQTQKQSDGSAQVVGDQAHVNIRNIHPTDKKRLEEALKNAKVFCCPKGHGNTVYPPDDNHSTASSEEDYAKKSALGTIIPIKYACEKEGCEQEFTLYWYQEKRGFVFKGRA